MTESNQRKEFRIHPANLGTYDWAKEFRTIQWMTLALVGAMLFCGFCVGYLVGVGTPFW